METGFPAEGKGQTAEAYLLPGQIALGRQEDFLRTVTVCGALSFRYGHFYTVNVGFYSMIHGFLLRNKEKEV